MTIQPGTRWTGLRLAELGVYRDLLWEFVGRDVKVRYKQTYFGLAWAVFQPLATMMVFSIFLGRLARVPSEGVAYPVFVYTGLVIWLYFAEALKRSGDSLLANAALVSKVFFPRLTAPIAGVIGPLVDLGVAYAVLVVMMVGFDIPATWRVMFIPVAVMLAMLTALAFGVWLAAINVQYRDANAAIPVLLQIWLFLSPVVYPSSLVPEGARFAYALNPMASVVDVFRWAVLGAGNPIPAAVAISAAVTAAILVGGLLYFRKVEQRFADWI